MVTDGLSKSIAVRQAFKGRQGIGYYSVLLAMFRLGWSGDSLNPYNTMNEVSLFFFFLQVYI